METTKRVRVTIELLDPELIETNGKSTFVEEGMGVMAITNIGETTVLSSIGAISLNGVARCLASFKSFIEKLSNAGIIEALRKMINDAGKESEDSDDE